MEGEKSSRTSKTKAKTGVLRFTQNDDLGGVAPLRRAGGASVLRTVLDASREGQRNVDARSAAVGLTDAGDLFHALGELAFAAFLGGGVVAAVFEVVGEALHVVLVVLAVVEGLHELGGGVAEVEGDGLGGGVCGGRPGGGVGGVDGVGFGGEGEVDGGLGEGEVAFRVAEEVHGVAGGEAEVEGFGGGEADVFDGHADEAAGDVHGVFAGFQHAGEPVEGGVGVRVADGFVEGGDDVVVLLAGLVVEEGAALEGFGGDRLGDDLFVA